MANEIPDALSPEPHTQMLTAMSVPGWWAMSANAP